MKLVHKVIAVVLLPAAVEAAIFLKLHDVVARTSEIAAQERRQIQIVNHIDLIAVHSSLAAGKLMEYPFSKSTAALESGRQAIAKMKTAFDELETLTADDAAQSSSIRKMRIAIESELEQLINVSPYEVNANYGEVFSKLTGLRMLVKQLGKKHEYLAAVLGEQQKRLEDIRGRENASLATVNSLITFAQIFNAMLAGGLILLFSRDVANRMRVLVRNASLLPRVEPLREHVSGSDELAYLDQTLHAASQELTQAKEQRNTLIGMLTHDLRSPIMSSMLAVDSYLQSHNSAKNENALRSVKRNLFSVIALINDLLMIDKVQEGNLELLLRPAELTELIEEALSSIQPMADHKSILLENQCSDAVLEVDRVRILQVLTNLLSNAIKFSQPASRIEVRSESLSDESGHIMISVTDSGPGVDPESKQTIFNKHFQTDVGKQTGGFGLGLAICKLVVECHGGRIGVDNMNPHGSKFWFTVPRANVK